MEWRITVMLKLWHRKWAEPDLDTGNGPPHLCSAVVWAEGWVLRPTAAAAQLSCRGGGIKHNNRAKIGQGQSKHRGILCMASRNMQFDRVYKSVVDANSKWAFGKIIALFLWHQRVCEVAHQLLMMRGEDTGQPQSFLKYPVWHLNIDNKPTLEISIASLITISTKASWLWCGEQHPKNAIVQCFDSYFLLVDSYKIQGKVQDRQATF